jgi:hypothetical protein
MREVLRVFREDGSNVPVRGAQLGHTRIIKQLQPRNCRALSRRSIRLQVYPIIMDSNAIHGYGTDFNVYETAAEGLRRHVIPQLSPMVMYAACTRLGWRPP